MSYLNVTDVSKYTPPENTSLIYMDGSDYKYKSSAGDSGAVNVNLFPLLGVEVADVPCLVFTSDLTAALAKTIVSTDGVTIAASSKAPVAYMREVANRKVDKTDFLSALSRTGEAIDTINETLETLGSPEGGSISAAISAAQSAAEAHADSLDSAMDSRVDIVEAAISGYSSAGAVSSALDAKVDKVSGSSLVSDSEIAKLAEFPAYSEVTSTVDSKIAAAVASNFKYMGVASNYTDLPASDAEGLEVGHVYHVTTKDGKTVNAEYAWNGTAWEELGSVIDLSNYYTSAQVTSAIAASSSAAVAEAESYASGLDSAMDARVDVLEAATSGYTSSGAIAAAISAAQGSAESYASGLDSAMDARVDVLEAAASGYDADNTISAAISATASAASAAASAAQSAAISAAAEDATSKSSAAESAAKAYADGLDSAMDARVDVLEAATSGYTSEGAIANAIAETSSAVTSAFEAADSTLNGLIAGNAADIVSLGSRADVLEAATSGFTSSGSIASAINAKADPVEVVVLGSGTDLAPQAVNLTTNKWYVVMAPFTGTLPAEAAEGTYIKVSVAVGGGNRNVVPAVNETICGSSNPCAVGITPEGVAIAGETYTFMKVGTDWVIL